MIDVDRGTGRTKRQMVGAPQNAVFVWCNGALSYPKDLARSIGRGDLRIAPPSYLNEPGNHASRLTTALVVDHAAQLSDRQRETLAILAEWSFRSKVEML